MGEMQARCRGDTGEIHEEGRPRPLARLRAPVAMSAPMSPLYLPCISPISPLYLARYEHAIPAASYALRFGTSIYGEGRVRCRGDVGEI